jgi:hypothetical protein
MSRYDQNSNTLLEPKFGQEPQNGTAVRFQPGQKTAGLCPVRVTNPPAQRGSGFWPVVEPNRTEPPVKTRTAGGLPGPVANTRWGQARLVGAGEAGGGRRGWWGQARLVGAGEANGGRKPPGQIPSQHCNLEEL